MKRILFSRGIEVSETTDGHRLIYMRYEHGKKQHRDRVAVVGAGPDLKKRQDKAVGEARKRLEGVRAEIKLARLDGREWVHPKDAKQREAEQSARQQADEQNERDALLYETVVGDFLKDEAYDDATPKETANRLRNRCSWAFAGKSWADITKQDRERYMLDRLNGTGWFEGWPRKVGLRSPQDELSTLRRIGNYLCRRGLMEFNPFAIPLADQNQRSCKKARRSALTYTPEREPVVPPNGAVRLMFSLCETGWTDGDGREIKPDPKFAALLALSAYTGSRPQSEPCRVRGGEIRLPSGNVRNMDGAVALGSVTYTDTKCGRPVTVPLTAHAASLVAEWVRLCPDDPEAYLFVKHDGRTPWDRESYRYRWNRLRARVADDYPEVARMVVRDFRKVFKTRLLEAGANPIAVKMLQGHGRTTDELYYKLTDEYAAKVVSMLNWQPGHERSREMAQGQ